MSEQFTNRARKAIRLGQEEAKLTHNDECNLGPRENPAPDALTEEEARRIAMERD